MNAYLQSMVLTNWQELPFPRLYRHSPHGAIVSWAILQTPIYHTRQFLADPANGRAYATVLRLSVCLWRYVLWLNGAS